MVRENIRLAFSSLRQAKLRSFLTMLGLIIGVGAVIAVLSIGEGVKREITRQVDEIGTNMIIVMPGNLDEEGFNPAAFANPSLTERDYLDIRELPAVEAAIASMLMSGTPSYGENTAAGTAILATTADYPRVVNQRVERGSFFGENGRFQAVLGPAVAEQLFGTDDPLGEIITLREHQFEVIGIKERLESEFTFGGFDYNSAVFIPLEAAREINHGHLNINEINARATSADDLDEAVAAIHAQLLANHGGEEDFSVLTQDEAVAFFNSIMDIVTAFIAAIAAIALLVGGVGIMNIMLASVTERTREIGIRKAIGANNRHILVQFLTEALTLSLLGGLLGIGFAFTIGLVVMLMSPITPVVTVWAVGLAVGVSVLVGVIFGLAPALKAARKDPIDALRYE